MNDSAPFVRSPLSAPPQRVSDRVQADIEALIRKRGLKPGSRLPSERALSEQLGASRTSLREAIGRLAARGTVEVRRTGIIVAQPTPSTWTHATISAPLAPLVVDHTGYGHDVMEVRQSLESTAAWFAAERADDAAKARIKARLDAMQTQHGATNPFIEAKLDADFHLAIAEASNNAVLYQVMSSMFGLLQASISKSLEKLYVVPQTFEKLSDQHRVLFDAIADGDAPAARAASEDHLQFVENTIRQIDDDLARKARASAARASGALPNSGETA